MKKPTNPNPGSYLMLPPSDVSDIEPIQPTTATKPKPKPKTNAQYQAAYRARMKADRTGGRLNTDMALKSLDNLGYIAEHHKISKRAMLERLIDSEADKVAISRTENYALTNELTAEEKTMVRQAAQKTQSEMLKNQLLNFVKLQTSS